jgi:hypothetical protein
MLLDIIYGVPIFVMGFVIMALAVGASIGALVLVHRTFPVEIRHVHNDVAGFLIAVVGVIYAVLLAFMAVVAWENYTRAEEIVETEANLLGDLFRNARTLSPELATAMHQDLRHYAMVVIEEEWPAHERGDTELPGWLVLEDLQATVQTFEPDNEREKIVLAATIDRLNQLFDARRDRFQMAISGIEPVVWIILLLGTSATIGFSLFFGVPNLKAHMAMTGLLAGSITLMIVLIVTLDHPFRGGVQVSPEPFERVIRNMDRLRVSRGNVSF